MKKPKFKTYEVYYDGELIETIMAASKKHVRENYTDDNESEIAFGKPKKWVMGWLEIKIKDNLKTEI